MPHIHLLYVVLDKLAVRTNNHGGVVAAADGGGAFLVHIRNATFRDFLQCFYFNSSSAFLFVTGNCHVLRAYMNQRGMVHLTIPYRKIYEH
eukprot:m.13977 g.13977  ORF g.13977 m.13977 type:complete len:91 (+) comp7476_c0_seq1:1352-1624(+)